MTSSSTLILSPVRPRVVIVHGLSPIRFSSSIGRGVVVTSARGLCPRLRPNCKFTHASSACRHLASSSHQAKSCSGPLRPSAIVTRKQLRLAPVGPFQSAKVRFPVEPPPPVHLGDGQH